MKFVIIIAIAFVLLVPITVFADYRVTSIENFPDPLKSPQEYFDRYDSESSYKAWFDSVFSENIEEAIGYHETHVEGFPNNSKSPFDYVKRYKLDSEYRSWFNNQFPSTPILDILGISLEDNSKILNEIGMEFYKLENDDESLKYFLQAIADDPNNTEAKINAGNTYYHLDDLGRSNQYYNEVLVNHPNDIDALLGLADNYWILENDYEANKNYAKVLKLESENAIALAGYGGSLVELGDESGLEYIEQALSFEPENVDFLFAKGYALTSMGKFNEAISAYKVVLKFEPKDSMTLNNIGDIYEQLGKFDSAQKYYQDALEVDSSNDLAESNLQRIPDVIQQQEEKEAVDAFWKLAELGIKLQVSIEEGDERNAKKYAQQAISLYENEIEPFMPDSPEKDRMEADLEYYKRELGLGEYAKPSIGGGCLIATATYGSELAPQVQQLREIRDNSLLTTESGTSFMNAFNDAYYSFSPIIADYERENPLFKEAVKIAITPMITSLSLMEYADSEESVLGIGISLILLNIGMYFVAPVIVIMRIRKWDY